MSPADVRGDGLVCSCCGGVGIDLLHYGRCWRCSKLRDAIAIALLSPTTGCNLDVVMARAEILTAAGGHRLQKPAEEIEEGARYYACAHCGQWFSKDPCEFLAKLCRECEDVRNGLIVAVLGRWPLFERVLSQEQIDRVWDKAYSWLKEFRPVVRAPEPEMPAGGG